MGSVGLDIRGEWAAGRQLVLYGAGGVGQTLARRMAACGIGISAFLDAGAAPGEIRADVPVFTLADWVKSEPVDGCDVLVSIHNPALDVAPIIAALRQAGFARVLTMIDYVNLFPEDADERDWLVPSAFYDDKQPHIDATRALLSDELSRTWFDAVMRLRLHGDYGALPEPHPADQYVPADLPRWAEPLRFIDCGAFDGDTISLMQQHGYDVAAVAAFEPDASNYAKLTARFSSLDAIFLPCGAAASAGVVRFDAGLGTSSRIGELGNTMIQCVSIDQAVPSFVPTLIKMDIEGAEPDALRGAEATLRRNRPGLAVALYHKPEHLWEIPLWLAGLGLGYRMYLRGHLHSGYELILYCRAD